MSRLFSTFALFAIFTLTLSLNLPSHYHTTEELNDKLENLQENCKYSLKLETIVSDPKIYLISLSKEKSSNRQKNYLLFGEHARELISPETGIHLIENICQGKSIGDHKPDSFLDRHDFKIVLNANPVGRAQVEQGDWCKRTNENDVDLNRNWDDHWAFSMAGDTFGGDKPFSEVEVVALKSSMAKYNPDVFITIHSGANSMFTPYAYSTAEPITNEKNMLDVLNQINPKYCDCEVGAAGAKVGYLSPGTCLDYAYDKLKVPYTFALEIYSSQQGIPRTRGPNFLQAQKKAKSKEEMRNHVMSHSCFAEVKSSAQGTLEGDQCFYFFNPADANEYQAYVENWSSALIEMVEIIHKKEN